MRLVTLAPLLICLLASPASAQINIERVLLGFTTATFDGGQGVLTYHAACAAEFPNSRMCFSQEVLSTPQTPTGLSGEAWVLPSFVPGASGSSGVRGFEASGLFPADPAAFACIGWSGALGSGLKMDSGGRLSFGACAVPLSITCCGPPIQLADGDLDMDGQVTIRDKVILERMLAGELVMLGGS